MTSVPALTPSVMVEGAQLVRMDQMGAMPSEVKAQEVWMERMAPRRLPMVKPVEPVARAGIVQQRAMEGMASLVKIVAAPGRERAVTVATEGTVDRVQEAMVATAVRAGTPLLPVTNTKE